MTSESRAAVALLAGLALGACAAHASPPSTAAPAPSAAPSAPPAGVTAALADFLDAFANLDWERFRAHFADDACVVHPAVRAERVCGRTDVEATFARVFAQERAAATKGPPYLELRPEDVLVQPLGPDAAVVSFHLRNDQRLARRTVVFARRDGAWRIVHLHASNLPRS